MLVGRNEQTGWSSRSEPASLGLSLPPGIGEASMALIPLCLDAGLESESELRKALWRRLLCSTRAVARLPRMTCPLAGTGVGDPLDAVERNGPNVVPLQEH